MKKIKLDLVDSNREYLIEILQLFKINFLKITIIIFICDLILH